MPVDKEEWEAGRTWETMEGKIVKFLKENRDKGFTQAEIFNGLGGYHRTGTGWDILGSWAVMMSIGTALENLVKGGVVRAKIIKKDIGEDTYYRIA